MNVVGAYNGDTYIIKFIKKSTYRKIIKINKLN